MSNKVKKEIFKAVNENVKALAQLFPTAVKDGEVDFEALKTELGEFTEVGAEKYDFTWFGKSKSKAEANADIVGRTLKLKPGDGVNEDTTQNIYIEGDNIEALKLLRNSYYGKIKMIYIDPPYNTGNDNFVYPDNFSTDKKELDEKTGEIEEGFRVVKNTKDNSQYHTEWLNIMYPRLRLARDLLTDDGVIFISIDDNEQENLKKICDEVFEASNFISQFTRVTKKGGKSTGTYTKNHDFIFAYAKNKPSAVIIGLEHIDDGFKYEDEFVDKRGKYKLNQTLDYNSLQYSKTMDYEIIIDGQSFIPGSDIEAQKKRHSGIHGKHDWVWRWSKDLVEWGLKNKWIVISSTGRIYTKTYLNAKIEKNSNGEYYIEYNDRTKPLTTLDFVENIYSNDNATKEFAEIMGATYFEYVKPTSLIKTFMQTCVDKTDIILDFFSGSATTAHAVMQFNAEDGGNRKFIMVQVPEATDEKSEARSAGYKNICEIGKERIRRAGAKIAEENRMTTPNLDIGFKVFKVADTNIKMFSRELNGEKLLGERQITSDDIAEQQEKFDFNHWFTDIDVCYELLLRHRGIPLSSKIEKLPMGERSYIIADSIVVCLDQSISETLVEQLAAIEPLPLKYIFRDSAFNDDISLKENAMNYLNTLIKKNNDKKNYTKTYRVEFI